jgi:methylenetetrahydrofolate--tRNA-(uracil-5-)-methyltransferase
MNEIKQINVIGAGLAGCEAAWQAAKLGVRVNLYEMKPKKFTPAHHSNDFCELVCSNSLRSNQLSNAVGLLKAELSSLGSLIMESAFENEVPAGAALAVDRVKFSKYITDKINNNDPATIEVINKTGGLLPETGGIGTTIFYIVGIALMLGAAILLITKKRMTAEAK